MIFTTWPFFVFMAVVFVCYWWVVPGRWRRGFLMVVSLGYFTYHYPLYTLLLGAMTLIVWVIGNFLFLLRIKKAPAPIMRRALTGGLLLCVGVLVYFKYTRMFATTWNDAMRTMQVGSSIDVPHILIPLGISFFTFEFIHYLVDVYLGKVTKSASLLDFGLFAFFFPSLVSGPVKRYQLFQQQSEEVDTFQATYLNEGLRRIVIGIAKKIIVADTANLLTIYFEYPNYYSRPQMWLAMYAYGVKIYYDFSGYTDIAIGCAQLLGYRLPENFNRPYRQENIQKFWNNWHMSLSSWIRDYIYFPMGGSRVSKPRALFNLTFVMAVCGLWHGANWNFLVWGLWNGVGLACHSVYSKSKFAKSVPNTRFFRWASTAVTIQFVCFGWVFFASPSLSHAMLIFHRMF